MSNIIYLFTRAILAMLGWLPVGAASAFGGWLAQCVGPRTGRHRVAQKNLQLIYPDQPQAWRDAVAANMWNHLGRVLGELPGLKQGKLLANMGEVEGVENLTVVDQAIFVSAHLGQWELLTPLAKRAGVGPILSLYRHVNNRRLDELLKGYRLPGHDELVAKKGDNAIALVRALKSGKSLALLIDQRLTKGDAMTFLGVMGRTNTAAMKLAVKMNVPIIPSFITRDKGATFKGKIYPPMYPPSEGSEDEKVATLARQVFDIIEQQIHAHPGQYLWLHNRWK